jgi:threonine/homoserine/homoserine lactone efflux protein
LTDERTRGARFVSGATDRLSELIRLALFALATFLLTVSPGPGLLYVTARTVSQGRTAGFASMFGIELGEVAWIAAAATGLAAVLATSTAALGVLRWVGAAYLILLGLQRWRSAETIPPVDRANVSRIFAQGFVTQIFNPKVAFFFVAFLPEFLDPARAVASQVALLGVVYITIAIAVDATYVLAASALSRRFLTSRATQQRANRVAAGTYVALGVGAAASGIK